MRIAARLEAELLAAHNVRPLTPSSRIEKPLKRALPPKLTYIESPNYTQSPFGESLPGCHLVSMCQPTPTLDATS
jgi:hypothetical protein